jgi:hypothetical protein
VRNIGAVLHRYFGRWLHNHLQPKKQQKWATTCRPAKLAKKQRLEFLRRVEGNRFNAIKKHSAGRTSELNADSVIAGERA